MIEPEYFLEVDSLPILVYQVIRFSAQEPWRVMLEGELAGSLEKLDGKWRQLSGNDFAVDLFLGLITLIDGQHFNDLPGRVMDRWPNVIQEVVSESDQKYLVVCKAGINLGSFEKIFSKFISDLLEDEWQVSFQVFNYDFSEDFSVVAKPGLRKKKTVGWD